MFTGKELKRRREALKMSQQQIGEQLGVSQNTISRIELGLNDRLTLHIAYNGLLNELEQALGDPNNLKTFKSTINDVLSERRLNNGTKEK